MVTPHTITRKQLQIFGSWGFEPRHVDKALALLENPHWQPRFASEIAHRYPLAQATEAVDNARQARGGKTVLVL